MMLSPSRLFRRLRHALTLAQRDREIDEELQFHLAMDAQKHADAGMHATEAARRARRDFGGVARYRDETRDAHGIRPLEDFLHDVRVGTRTLMRRRGFAIVAILTLAIGIGGTTAVFGAVYGVLLAPLPYADQSRVMTVWQTDSKTGNARGEVSVPNFIDWRTRNHTFAHLAISEPFSLDYIGKDGPEVFDNAIVTEGFFESLGVTPILGRTFIAEEFTPGRNKVVVFSERLWRTRFGGDSSMVGRPIVLDGEPLVLVGVVPRAVDVPYGVQAWTPKVFRPDELTARRSAYYTVIGRLRNGVSVEAAQRDMSTIAAELTKENPQTNATTGVVVVPIAEALVGSSRKGLLILLGAVGFVLLIACVNVASLQLAQAVRRRRELVTRATLGAGAWRIARQLFAESLVLALAGGAAGLAVAYWGLAGIRAIAPADLPRVDELQLQPQVLAFALGLTVMAAIAFGMAPALDARRLHLADAIAADGRSTTGSRSRRRLQRLLVVSEVALALVLLVGAGLLVRSFRALVTIDRGFQTDHVLVATVQSWSFYRTPAERAAFVRDASQRLGALLGVSAVGMTSTLPLSAPIGMEATGIAIEGVAPLDNGELRSGRVVSATPGYFDALRIPVRAGRKLTAADRDSSSAVVLVSESFVRQYWPNESPIGKHVTFGFQNRPMPREVVGVVADVRRRGLDRDPEPTIYAPHGQASTGAIHFTMRTNGEPGALERAVRGIFASMNASMPVSQVMTLDAVFDSSLRDRRFNLALLTAFSVTALLLAAIGIYGLLSQLTGERTREIGVRVAIGASTGHVLMMVVRQGTTLAILGVLVGLGGAVALTRLLQGMLFNVTPLDPLAFGIALGALLVCALVACWIPAIRAARVDPMEALRND